MKCGRCGGRMYVDRDLMGGGDDWTCIQCGAREAARQQHREVAQVAEQPRRPVPECLAPVMDLHSIPGMDTEMFARAMTGLMADVISKKVTPQEANAACNAASQLLKLMEMHFKYVAPPKPNP